MTIYKLEFEVRDSELDMQGVVNNSNYFRYLEHTRHKFIREIGASFSEMSKANQNFFLISSTIDFKKSLRSEDKFYVTCYARPEGRIKFACEQEIRLLSDDTLIARATNIVVCIDGNNRNKPYIPDFIKEQFHPH